MATRASILDGQFYIRLLTYKCNVGCTASQPEDQLLQGDARREGRR